MILREYQQRCVEDCIDWIKKSIEPAVVDATVSFGKSVVIAELARRINELSGKSVLILCPSGNLATQNSGKLKALGVKHSMFSASVGLMVIRRGRRMRIRPRRRLILQNVCLQRLMPTAAVNL